MLQIRLIRDSSLEIGGSAKPSPVETVTVACPDHLVLADLPVAKSLAAAPSASIVKTVGRRSRRHLGERVHVCVRCDFPIAIYGRLSPCEHAFCLACARSDSSCYLCDERIQKIQTIKMLEGIFICAAPHCLKSFLKRPEFEAHIHETHTDLLQQPIAVVKEELNNETDSFAVARLPSSSASDVAQGKQPPPDSSSTPLGQPRPVGFSHSSNFQQTHDREDRTRWHQPREAPAVASPPNVQQPKPPPMFYSPHMHQIPESQPENNYLQQQGFDRPPPFSNNNRFPPHQQSFDNQQGATHYRRDNDQLPDMQSGILPEPSSFPEYSLPHSFHHHHQLPSLQGPSNVATQAPPLPPPFGYNMPLPTEGSQSQPYYNSNVNNPHSEMNRPESEIGSLEPPGGSLLGFPPTAHPLPGLASTNYPRVWNMGLSPMPPFEHFSGAGQGPREGYGNPSTDNTASTTSSQSQGRAPFYRGNHGWVPGGLSSFEVPVGSGTSERKDGKGVLAPLPSPLPLPPPPPPLSQYERGKFTSSASGGGGDVGREGGQGYGRHGDRRGFGSGQD